MPQEISDRDLIEDVHYKKATGQEIAQWDKEGKTLFVRSEADRIQQHTGSGFGSASGSFGSAQAGKSCVLIEEVLEVKSQYKVRIRS